MPKLAYAVQNLQLEVDAVQDGGKQGQGAVYAGGGGQTEPTSIDWCTTGYPAAIADRRTQLLWWIKGVHGEGASVAPG